MCVCIVTTTEFSRRLSLPLIFILSGSYTPVVKKLNRRLRGTLSIGSCFQIVLIVSTNIDVIITYFGTVEKSDGERNKRQSFDFPQTNLSHVFLNRGLGA